MAANLTEEQKTWMARYKDADRTRNELVARARKELSVDVDELERCITLYRRLRTSHSKEMPVSRGRLLTSLARVLFLCYEQSKSQAKQYLDECIEIQYQARDLCERGQFGHLVALDYLARYLRARYLRPNLGQSTKDLKECIACLTEALQICNTPVSSLQSQKFSILHKLAEAHYFRFKRDTLTNRGDLDKCICLYQDAQVLHGPGHPNWIDSTHQLSVHRHIRFLHTRDDGDLEIAIQLERKAMDNCAPGPSSNPRYTSQRISIWTGLAAVLYSSFQSAYDLSHLHDCIKYQQQALDRIKTSYRHPDSMRALVTMSKALCSRFQSTGHRPDIERAIQLSVDAWNLSKRAGDRDEESSTLNGLANIRRVRFLFISDSRDLEASIYYHRKALSLRTGSHRERLTSLINLSTALFNRYLLQGPNARYDLEECLRQQEEALHICPSAHPSRSKLLNNRSTALRSHFQHTRDIKYINESIRLQIEARLPCKTGFPDHHIYSRSLAMSLVTRYQTDKQRYSDDLNKAMNILASVSNPREPGLVDPSQRLHTATYWAMTADMCNHSSAIEAYGSALEQMQQALDTYPTLRMQHAQLRRWGTLTLDAASCAVKKGTQERMQGTAELRRSLDALGNADTLKLALGKVQRANKKLEMAVKMLEQGRAVVWSEMRRLRTSPDDFGGIDVGLRKRYNEAKRALQGLLLSCSSVEELEDSSQTRYTKLQSASEDAFGYALETKRRLVKELADIVAEIRTVPGFETFLKSPSYETLREVAAEGPVIMVNHSSYSSHALIILHKDDPISVSLSDDFFDRARELSLALLEAGSPNALKYNSRRFNGVLRDTLADLWSLIVGPVVRALKHAGVKKDSRIWWCPTSVLSALPLHAAGPIPPDDDCLDMFGDKKKPKKPYLTDLFVSSYTPTLTALREARASASQSPSEPQSILVVAQPGNSLRPLDVDEEIASMKSLSELCHRLNVLEGSSATPPSVTQGFQRHSWTHFVCHGILEPGEPFNSAFLLADGRKLTLREIFDCQVPNAEFAFLSACDTAHQTRDSAQDEVLHLAAAMQFSGFRGVVGTMWQMKDKDGPRLAKHFYTDIFSKGGKWPRETGFKAASRALRTATLKLRREKGVELEQWVNFVHIGV